MYGKLILRSARRSVQDYLIYLVTLTLCVGLFYAFLSSPAVITTLLWGQNLISPFSVSG